MFFNVCMTCEKSDHVKKQCHSAFNINFLKLFFSQSSRARLAQFSFCHFDIFSQFSLTLIFKTSSERDFMIKDIIDCDAKFNYLSQFFFIIFQFSHLFKSIAKIEYLNKIYAFLYETFHSNIIFLHFANCHEIQFFNFAVVDMSDFNFILSYFWLAQIDLIIRWRSLVWYNLLNYENINIQSSEKFLSQCLKNQCQLYTYFLQQIQENYSLSESLHEFENVFFEKNASLVSDTFLVKHSIELLFDKNSLFHALYNLFEKKLHVFKKYINDKFSKKWIKLFINLSKASVLFALKSDEFLHLCVNYKELNEITHKDRYSLSWINELLDKPFENKIFFKLDLRDVYHRIFIRSENEWKIVFRIKYDYYEYIVMLFNLINVFATFQIYIHRAPHDLLNNCCIVYLNDILIFYENEKKHEKHLHLVLSRLEQFKLYVKLVKCSLFQFSVNFFKYFISVIDVHMKSARVKTVKNWSEFRFYHNIQIFLKFVNFYRRFIHNFFIIIHSLISLLKDSQNEKKKISFHFPNEARNVFVIFKKVFCTTSLLKHFNFFKWIKLETDVFTYVAETILSQFFEITFENDLIIIKWHSVTFWSFKFNFSQTNYDTSDHEMYITVKAFVHWRHYF